MHENKPGAGGCFFKTHCIEIFWYWDLCVGNISQIRHCVVIFFFSRYLAVISLIS